jgi:hypothetical protein
LVSDGGSVFGWSQRHQIKIRWVYPYWRWWRTCVYSIGSILNVFWYILLDWIVDLTHMFVFFVSIAVYIKCRLVVKQLIHFDGELNSAVVSNDLFHSHEHSTVNTPRPQTARQQFKENVNNVFYKMIPFVSRSRS